MTQSKPVERFTRGGFLTALALSATSALGVLEGCGSSHRAAPTPRSSPAPLPAFAPNSRLLFQGDSITDGDRQRSATLSPLLGNSYVSQIAARYDAAFPEYKLVFLNRGIIGDQVTDLAARWQRDTLELKPDLLSVLIGVNDTGRAPLDLFEPTYDKLLTDARAENPKLRLVLLEPFCLPIGYARQRGKSWVAELNERRELVGGLAKKHNAVLVPCQKIFTEACIHTSADYLLWDGIHPTDFGHQLLADAWTAAVHEAS